MNFRNSTNRDASPIAAIPESTGIANIAGVGDRSMPYGKTGFIDES